MVPAIEAGRGHARMPPERGRIHIWCYRLLPDHDEVSRFAIGDTRPCCTTTIITALAFSAQATRCVDCTGWPGPRGVSHVLAGRRKAPTRRPDERPRCGRVRRQSQPRRLRLRSWSYRGRKRPGMWCSAATTARWPSDSQREDPISRRRAPGAHAGAAHRRLPARPPRRRRRGRRQAGQSFGGRERSQDDREHVDVGVAEVMSCDLHLGRVFTFEGLVVHQDLREAVGRDG